MLSLMDRNPFGPANKYQTLDMYLTHIDIIKDKHYKIKGIIVDKIGTADFIGEIVNKELRLVKKYNYNTILKGATTDITILVGNKKEKYYMGVYSTLKEGNFDVQYDKNKRFGIRVQYKNILN
jgi:hypothetical protein